MNKTVLKNKLNALTQQYPKHLCEGNITEAEKCNALDHAAQLYKITCAIVDLWFTHLISKRTVRSYGEILRHYEYYYGEAGLEHFSVFNGI